LPATWSTYLVARKEYGGAVRRPGGPIAYFETDPVKPSGLKVNFDASFSRRLDGIGTLTYAWDFGDGTHATGQKVSHTFAGPAFADVKLVVRDSAGDAGVYRQAIAVGGSKAAAPSTPACGEFSLATANKVLAENGLARATRLGTQQGPNPLGLPSTKTCKDRRRFRFHIHQHHKRIVRVKAYVNGKKVQSLHGHRITRLTLKKLPRGVFQVRIVAVASNGQRVISVRTYRGCKKSKPHTRIKHPH
ncbi:MAG: serine protease, partial [Thermoleophilaceae bacterium]|nr:serine protease [Thermoleophilaceae bacterium]